MIIKIGTCGFPISRQRCYKLFNVVELQETFYDMPNEEKMKSLRKEAPKEFEFTVKVFQAITHPKTSPTWKRMKFKLLGNLDNYGYLKPTKENFEIWEQFYNVTKHLEANIYIFQTPGSMPIGKEIAKNVIEFFNTIKKKGIVIGWEPRGNWYTNEGMKLLQEIIENTGIVHVVDPFRRLPIKIQEITYFRLHGIGPGEVNYRYKYTEDDLKKLIEICKEVKEKGSKEVYVMFNNIYMAQDAERFKQMIYSIYKRQGTT